MGSGSDSVRSRTFDQHRAGLGFPPSFGGTFKTLPPLSSHPSRRSRSANSLGLGRFFSSTPSSRAHSASASRSSFVGVQIVFPPPKIHRALKNPASRSISS